MALRRDSRDLDKTLMKQAMESAIQSAMEGITSGNGGPFGAAIVCEGKVISHGHNTVLRDVDPSCHAEVNAIRKACKHLGEYHLPNCVLFTTAEPCPMCLSTAMWARIPRIVVGVPKDVAKEFGFDDSYFYEQVCAEENAREIQFEKNFLSTECRSVFEKWKSLGGKLY